METRIEAVLFDWGGVLIDDPGPGLMSYCAKVLGVSVEDYTRVHSHRGEPFQRGAIREGVFWRRVCEDLGCLAPKQPSLWGEAFRAVYSPRQEVFDLARRLREKGCRTGLLSNTEVPAMEFFLGLRYDAFDAATFSCGEGVVKPQREIYEIAARKLGVTPARCAFIDDKPEFVEGARAAGMKGVVYEDSSQVVEGLVQFGIRAR
ncbi:MAG TPA: HAD family phosphatase [Sedimentisphaerales bacterium]|jgi:putative hydrolase of the HAD superfamily|nr:HAD family phosphatase [Sedimentisphaerales bacterium]HNU31316.1 HAD family phosphatase [Sedimentisphaerales bacterium]